jgi:REP element-mobilizing transposase RayT
VCCGPRPKTVSTVSRIAFVPPSAYTSRMSLHSYSRVWLHVVWATLERRPLLSKDAAAKLSRELTRYAAAKDIYMKINYVNPDHVHVLVDLPTALSIEEVMRLLTVPRGNLHHFTNAATTTTTRVKHLLSAIVNLAGIL